MKKYILISICFLLVTMGLRAQTYEDLVNKSLDYIERKDYQAAEQTLKEAMRREPANKGNILLLSNLGTIQRALGKPEEALLSYNAALSKYPKTPTLLMNRAALYCEIDSLDLAMRDYNIILSMDADNIQALDQRGLLYLSQKNLLAAETDFEHILEIQPKNLKAKSSLAFAQKSRGDWEAAEEAYTDLIYDNKNISDLYVNRAECYLQLKKLGRAKEDLQKAQQMGYDDAFLYILKGQLALQQFDKLVAKQNFEKALELGANKEVIDQYLLLCK